MPEPEKSKLDDFFRYIYGDITPGYVYVATKKPGNQHAFTQHFFEWPKEAANLSTFVRSKRADWEVYYAPALFNERSATKNSVKGAQVVWVEFDGNVPDGFGSLPEPTLRIQSSNDGHEHCYWRLDSFLAADELERINRSLTYSLGADSSGWDACQILRPPETLNHKRSRDVQVLDVKHLNLPAGLFDGLPQPPPPVDAPIPESIPAIEDVIFRYKFPDAVIGLFKHGVAVGHRSTGLMALGYYLAEMNLTNEEMLSVLLNADKRWGKFDGRSDQLQRLMEVITISRQKYPFKPAGTVLQSKLQPLGFTSLLATDVHLEWVWEGFLQRAGYMLLTGPSGVGKTQLSLDVASSMCLGLDALGKPVQRPKIGFFSLEMGLVDLKVFISQMAKRYTLEELEELEEHLKFFPLGEPLYLNKPETREAVEQAIIDNQLDGIIVDSLGSATDDELSDDVAARKLMHWNDQMRQKLDCFSWFIHHHRKASGDNKKPNKLADVFGSQYWTSYATSVVCLWQTATDGVLDFIPLKVRLAKKPEHFHIKRDDTLHFVALSPGVVKIEEATEEETEITVDMTPDILDSTGGFNI